MNAIKKYKFDITCDREMCGCGKRILAGSPAVELGEDGIYGSISVECADRLGHEYYTPAPREEDGERRMSVYDVYSETELL